MSLPVSAITWFKGEGKPLNGISFIITENGPGVILKILIIRKKE